MNPDRWRRIEDLCHAAAARAPGERAAFLAEACGDDVELRREVESLLREESRAEQVLGTAGWRAPALAVGTRLGAYEILGLIGAGGMGEVYKARDTRLDRTVAVKVLPDLFKHDPERLVRFEREAKVLASLNHPNIAQVHGFEDLDGVKALVLEFVEGATLADRIARGPIPLDEALPIARQITEALEAAHEHGVIHRDLKPANVKVREDGAVKVLDFGLAKALAPGDGSSVGGRSEPASPDAANSPTITSPATRRGVILGTAAYMAPEQARGKAVDKRADVWAFGAVLYELLTGRRAFEGESVTDTMVSVLGKEPAWDALPPTTPPAIRKLLRRCLEKDRRRRLDSIADARLEIDDAQRSPAADGISEAPRRPPLRPWQRPVIAATVASVLVGGLTGLVTWRLLQPPAASRPQVSRWTIDLPSGDLLPNAKGGAVLSPNGRTIVYAASRDGREQLFRRAVDALEGVPIPNTEGADFPFFSPDGASVGFFDGTSLKRVALAGGPATTVCEADYRFGASWGADGTIVFATRSSPGLMRVAAAGGTPEPLTRPENDMQHRWPEWLPNGQAVLFTVVPRGGETGDMRVAVRSIVTGKEQILLEGTSPHYLAPAYLVFARDGVLWAASFDPERLAMAGDAVPVGSDRLWVGLAGWAQFGLSSQGSLVYRSPGTRERRLVWVDRAGREEPTTLPAGRYQGLTLSPDGRRVAIVVTDADNLQGTIWVGDLERGTLTPLTSEAEPPAALALVWTADGREVIWSSEKSPPGLFRRAADGAGEAERLTKSTVQSPLTVTPDGTQLIVNRGELWGIPLTGHGEAVALVKESGIGSNAAIAPDGRWLAYDSATSGRAEIAVRPFPHIGRGRWQVSSGGGQEPAWQADGRALYYVTTSGQQLTVMTVAVPPNPSASWGQPQAVVTLSYPSRVSFGPRRHFAVAPDGQRFLLMKEGEDTSGINQKLQVVLNWFEEVKAKVPVGR